MGVDTPARPNGFKVALDTILAPKEAFEAIRTAPTWFIALAITIVVTMIGSYLQVPATAHALAADWPNQVAKSPGLAGMTSDQQQAALASAQKIIGFGFISWLIIVPFFTLVSTIVMAIFNALGRGEGSFGKYWAAACNIGLVGLGISFVILTAIVLVRGADSFNSPAELQRAIPSLAMLAPGSSPKLLALLYAFNPMALWSSWLTVVAMQVIGRVPSLQAWLAGITMFLIPTLIGVGFAK